MVKDPHSDERFEKWEYLREAICEFIINHVQSWLCMWYRVSLILKDWYRIPVQGIFQKSIVPFTVVPAIAAYTTLRELFDDITLMG
jgi:hypothetical protein